MPTSCLRALKAIGEASRPITAKGMQAAIRSIRIGGLASEASASGCNRSITLGIDPVARGNSAWRPVARQFPRAGVLGEPVQGILRATQLR